MTIRINLLPHREIKRAARRRQLNVFLGAAAAAGVATVVLGHTIIAARLDNQQARNQYLTEQIAKLDNQIGQISKIKEETHALLDRKRVVETLQDNRTEVVHLFDQLIKLLPEGMYLSSIKENGNVLTINGYAQSSARVSTLMRNLEGSQWFKKPSLVEIKAATVNNLRANEFTLNVQLTHTAGADGNGKKAKS